MYLAEPQAAAYPLASNIIYTDGSAGESSQGQRIGAGVYCAEPSMQLKIDPCGISATNTITRAELGAIYAALQKVGPHDCTVATRLRYRTRASNARQGSSTVTVP